MFLKKKKKKKKKKIPKLKKKKKKDSKIWANLSSKCLLSLLVLVSPEKKARHRCCFFCFDVGGHQPLLIFLVWLCFCDRGDTVFCGSLVHSIRDHN